MNLSSVTSYTFNTALGNMRREPRHRAEDQLWPCLQQTILEDANLYTPPSNSTALQCLALLTHLVGTDWEVMRVCVRSQRAREAVVFLRVILACPVKLQRPGDQGSRVGYKLNATCESGAAYKVEWT